MQGDWIDRMTGIRGPDSYASVARLIDLIKTNGCYGCPFCYIVEKKLALALEKTGMAEAVEIVFNSFELDPQAQKH